MAISKMNFKDTIHGFKSIACRNSILIMVIVSFDSFSINMKNAVRTLIGLNSVGLSPTRRWAYSAPYLHWSAF